MPGVSSFTKHSHHDVNKGNIATVPILQMRKVRYEMRPLASVSQLLNGRDGNQTQII